MRITPIYQNFNINNTNYTQKPNSTALKPSRADSVSFSGKTKNKPDEKLSISDMFKNMDGFLFFMNESLKELHTIKDSIDDMVLKSDENDTMGLLLLRDIFKMIPEIDKAIMETQSHLLKSYNLYQYTKDKVLSPEYVNNNPEALDLYLEYTDRIGDLPFAQAELGKIQKANLKGAELETATIQAMIRIQEQPEAIKILDELATILYELPENRRDIKLAHTTISQSAENTQQLTKAVLDKMEKASREPITKNSPEVMMSGHSFVFSKTQ